MTLDEAIEHAEEQDEIDGVCDCAMEHRQLAEWLKELQECRTKVSEMEEYITKTPFLNADEREMVLYTFRNK